MRFLVWTVLASLLLAGCSSAPSSSSGTECTLEPALCDPQHYLATHPCIVNRIEPRVYAPDTPGPEDAANPWKLGDWWTYQIDNGGATRTTVLTYFKDIDFDGANLPQHYLVGAGSADDALDHALYSTNPMLGRIHRALYSPHEQGMHADMFAFPLCDGSTWTTSFYATPFDLKATLTPLTLPDGRTDPLGFTISGASSDGARLTHTYSPLVKWFTSLQLARADGSTLNMKLTAFGEGRSGEFHFLRAQQDVVENLAGLGEKTITREDGREGPYDHVAVALDMKRTSGTGKVEVHLRDPSGASVACVGVSGSGVGGQTACPSGKITKLVPYTAGAWKITVEKPATDLASPTTISGEARVVSVYARGGSL